MQYNITIYTDGSGYDNGVSGYCGYIVNNVTGDVNYVLGSATNASVNRAELMAIVESLRFLLQSDMFYDGISVLVLSDSDSVVQCINWETSKYKRKANKDLWVVFDYFSEKINITAEHTPRDDLEENKYCDLHASTISSILKEYVEDIMT